MRPVDGCDVVTTLDLDLQDVADKALRQQLERQNALWGTTIVMETRTAISSPWPTSGAMPTAASPNARTTPWGRSMEPGSTFKLATMLTLLDDAPCPSRRPTTPPTTATRCRWSRQNIRDSHRGDHVIDFRRAVASSSNVYFAEAMGTATASRAKTAVATTSQRAPSGRDGGSRTVRRTETLDHHRLEGARPGGHAREDGLRLPRRLAPIQMITLLQRHCQRGADDLARAGARTPPRRTRQGAF